MGRGLAGVRGRVPAGALKAAFSSRLSVVSSFVPGQGTGFPRGTLVSQYIFIYGTLRPGLAPDEIARVVENLKAMGEGSARGVLYNLGEYPGAVLDATADSRIYGSVFELPKDADVLRELDRYEGFNPDNKSDSLFVRVKQTVELVDGRTIDCWIYVYNLEPVGARVVTDGRYKNSELAPMRGMASSRVSGS